MKLVLSPRLAAGVLACILSGAVHAAPCAGFTDVDDTNAFCTSIAWMKNRAITLGCTATEYCPADFVRRDQMAAFMYRLGFQNAFLNGGNAYGATAVLGTTDAFPVRIVVGGHAYVRVSAASASNFESGTTVPNLVAGHPANFVSLDCAIPVLCIGAPPVVGAVIAGGGSPNTPNRVTENFSTVGGGLGNKIGDSDADNQSAEYATIGGGLGHLAEAAGGTIAGGSINHVSGLMGAVGGGEFNHASGQRSTIAGGYSNDASGGFATVGGGRDNLASGAYATVPGGIANIAAGQYSFAAGRSANAQADGSFVFADSSAFAFAASTPNSFRVRATGGVRFVTDIDGAGAITWSCVMVSGTGWTCSSDRNLKQDLEPLDGEAVLDKLAAMPVYAWSPKGRNAHQRHYGPMAQDFHVAFGLGDDDTMIGMQDAEGVALAAIQGLNRRLEGEVSALRAQNAELAATVRELAAEMRALREGTQR